MIKYSLRTINGKEYEQLMRKQKNKKIIKINNNKFLMFQTPQTIFLGFNPYKKS